VVWYPGIIATDEEEAYALTLIRNDRRRQAAFAAAALADINRQIDRWTTAMSEESESPSLSELYQGDGEAPGPSEHLDGSTMR